MYKEIDIEQSILNKWGGLSSQERIYIRYIKDKMPKKGFFFECGAHDGMHMSTTYGLESIHGWSGILVEAHTGLYKLLKNNNRSAICVNECIGISGTPVYFMENYRGHLGHSQIVDKDKIPKTMHDNVVKKYSKSVEQILSENNAPEQIDYMIIDVENGYESAVKGIDFDKRNIIYLCIEMNGTDTNMINYICSKGYSIHHRIGKQHIQDIIFVNDK